jgi:hypothetical protein
MKPDAHKAKASYKWKLKHGIKPLKESPALAVKLKRPIVDNSFRFQKELEESQGYLKMS